MRAASCFSGIGGAEAAWPDGEWLWCAEIEPAPSDILAARFPHSENLGDVLADDFIDRARAYGPIDLLCGGCPCQSFSVAGLRKGMSDPRGQLSIRFVEILHAIRPRNALVENVPGWLNHPDNAFGCFLGAVVGADDALPAPDGGSWPRAGMVAGPRARIAWRILDAQYFKLAQRRERVFVVVDFGEGADPAAVLFERQSGVGDPAAGRKAGQGITGTLSARTQGGGGLGTDFECDGGLVHCHEVAPTLNTHLGDKQGLEDQHINGGCGHFIAHTLRAEGFDASEDGTGRGTPLVPVAYRTSGNCGAWETGDRTDALTTGTDQTQHVVANQWAVRRLTPTECERLQGFPVGHTLIETGKRRTVDADEAAYLTAHGAHVVLDNEGRYRTNAIADGPRYKALGNAWAVNVARWIIARIAAAQSTLSPMERAMRRAQG